MAYFALCLPYMHSSSSAYRTKPMLLFLILGFFFLTNALLAEFVGVKIFSLEKTLGITPFSFEFFGQSGLSFNLTTGVLLWPFVFILTDIINEYFGKKGVRILSYVAVAMILYSFLAVKIAIGLAPADFWIWKDLGNGEKVNLEVAFTQVFGQGLWIIIGSVVAFLIGQLVDVTVFHRLKKITGNRNIWIRATGSTLVSQLVDSFVVLWIAFYWGANWPLSLVLAVCSVNYMYKFVVAVAMTPVLYWIHGWIDRFLGEELSKKLQREAIEDHAL